MKIVMKVLSCGPAGTFRPGQVVDAELPEAKKLKFVEKGYATDADLDPPPVPTPVKSRAPKG